MGSVKFSQFGKNIAHRLIDIEQTQEWLIGEIRKDTGLFCDNAYMHKIKTGKLKTPSIIQSICKILEIPLPENKEHQPSTSTTTCREQL